MEEHFSNTEYLAVFAGIIALTFLVAFIFNRFASKLIRKSAEKLKTDPTNQHFLRHMISALIYIVGFGIAIYTIPSLRTLAQSLLAGAGIAALAIGFAAKDSRPQYYAARALLQFSTLPPSVIDSACPGRSFCPHIYLRRGCS